MRKLLPEICCCRSLRVLFAAAVLLCANLLQAAPRVTTSIKPLELLAAPVTAGVSVPQLLLQQDQDPHNLALRPSERHALENADLVLWVGQMLELPLAKALTGRTGAVLTVQELDGLRLLSTDAGPDPHVWLDTRNARLVTQSLALALGELDPEHAARYQGNADAFATELDMLDQELQTLFTGLEQREWAVYHHALGYFQQQFGLREPQALTDSENTAPGVRSVLALRERLAADATICLLIEPGVNEGQLRNLLAPLELRLVSVDLLGHASGPPEQAYIHMLRALGQRLSACLRG